MPLKKHGPGCCCDEILGCSNCTSISNDLEVTISGIIVDPVNEAWCIANGRDFCDDWNGTHVISRYDHQYDPKCGFTGNIDCDWCDINIGGNALMSISAGLAPYGDAFTLQLKVLSLVVQFSKSSMPTNCGSWTDVDIPFIYETMYCCNVSSPTCTITAI